MPEEPQEIGSFGILIRVFKDKDGKISMNTKTQHKNFSEEFAINILENHLKFLKERKYKQYLDNMKFE